MGLANEKSIAWGIAKAVAGQGAELAFSYQSEALQKRVGAIGRTVGLGHRPALRRCGHEQRGLPVPGTQGPLGQT